MKLSPELIEAIELLEFLKDSVYYNDNTIEGGFLFVL